jgi:hypothetical protein
MCEHQPFLSCRPFQHHLILCFRKGSVLHSDEIQIREEPQEPSYDPAVEVLVCCQTQH